MCTTIQTGLKPTSTVSELADYGNGQFAKKIMKKANNKLDSSVVQEALAEIAENVGKLSKEQLQLLPCMLFLTDMIKIIPEEHHSKLARQLIPELNKCSQAAKPDVTTLAAPFVELEKEGNLTNPNNLDETGVRFDKDCKFVTRSTKSAKRKATDDGNDDKETKKQANKITIAVAAFHFKPRPLNMEPPKNLINKAAWCKKCGTVHPPNKHLWDSVTGKPNTASIKRFGYNAMKFEKNNGN